MCREEGLFKRKEKHDYGKFRKIVNTPMSTKYECT